MRIRILLPIFFVIANLTAANWDLQNQTQQGTSLNSGISEPELSSRSNLAIIYVSGTLTGNTVWTSGNLYVIQGNVSIPSGSILTIEPGTIIKFELQYFLTVGGTLIADGTPTDKIVFTSIKDDSYGGDTNGDGTATSPAAGDWNGIVFSTGSSSSSIIDNCKILYAGLAGSGSNLSAIKLDNVSPQITNNEIRYSIYYGIYCLNGASPNIQNNIISEMQTGVYCTSSANPLINNNVISFCTQYGILANSSSDPTITNNSFENITGSGTSYPLMLASNLLTHTINGNTGSNNRRNGIALSGIAITSNSTLLAGNTDFPYIVAGGFSVSAGITLTIEPGTIIKFELQYFLTVGGTLIADGTPTDKIVFTSIKDDSYGGDTNGDGTATSPAAGDWNGIVFSTGSSSSSIIDNCKILYAGLAGSGSNLSAIKLDNVSPQITNNEIRYSIYYGIYCLNGASPNIQNNIISEMQTGVYCTSSANPLINNNVISFCTQYGILANSSSDPTITNNSFENITGSGTSYPLMLASNLLTHTINGNTGSNNRRNGIALSGIAITSNSTLLAGNTDFPYIVAGGFSVSAGITLTIEPGTIIKFELQYFLTVGGTLIADGTPTDKIVFTSIKDDSYGGDTNGDGTATSPAAGDWNGIVFSTGSSSSSIIDNCKILYAGLAGSGSNLSAIKLDNVSPQITNNEIRYSIYYGIYCLNGASPNIQNNIISEMQTGVYCTSSANPVIYNNSIINQSSYGVLNNTSSINIMAKQNWWGDVTGPLDNSDDTGTGGWYNPSGLGSRVSDYVNYQNWLLQLPIFSTIQVVTPNGGEILNVYGSYDITWNSDNVTDVSIDYTTNNGVIWLPITATTPSDGLYHWIVPNTPSQQCKIKITDLNNPIISDKSSGIFTINLEVQTVTLPNLFISSASITAGSSIIVSGTNFSSNASVLLRFFGPPGFEQQNVPLMSNASGDILYTYNSGQNYPSGIYSVYAIDELNNLITQTCYFEINQPTEVYEILISNPLEGDEYREGENLTVRWADKMDPGLSYPINGAQRAYNYNIEISNDAGSTWSAFGNVNGYKPIGTVQVFELTSALSGTGSNCYIKVTDIFNTSRTVTNGAFSILPMISTNLQVELFWDYSFPEYRVGNPLGVASDGVARIYLKLSKINPGTGGQINSVNLALSDGVSSEPRILGKVMVATVTNQYSEEANSASDIQVTDNTTKNEYWFWYVSPDDFVRDEILDGLKSERKVTAAFTITYDGGAQEVMHRDIIVVRPPIMLVHGLGSNSSTWDNFAWVKDFNRTLFKNDYRFLVRKAVTLEPSLSFSLNSQRLLSDRDASSFPKATLDMKQKGYANNQVYYICHSMGGNLIRAAIQLYPTIFYKNYQKGYVDRIITLDTPHKGSPLADLIEEWLESLNDNRAQRLLLTWMHGEVPNFLGFNFLQPEDLSKWIYKFKLTGAVSDLRTNNGFQHMETAIPSHLVVGDFFPGEQILPGVDPAVWEAIEFAKKYVDFLDIFFDVVLNSSTISGELKSQLKPLRYLNKAERVVKFIEITLKSYVALGFVLESDLIVGVKSQLAGLPRNGPNQSIFDVHTHSAWLPYPIISSDYVGNRVYQLINTSIFNSAFANIPASNFSPVSNTITHKTDAPSRALVNDSTGITLITPTYGTTVYVDSTLNLVFSITDTTNLSYIKMNFQNNSIVDTTKNFLFDFSLQVNGSAIDSQLVTITAIKEYSDSVVISSTSTILFVSTNSPIVDFSVEPLLLNLAQNQTISPKYQAEFPTFLSSIGSKSSGLSTTIGDPSILEFDPIQKQFRALSNGETYALVSYKGLTDTIYFIVEGEETFPLPPDLYSPQNQTQILPENISLVWNQSESASEYQLQVSIDVSFTSTLINQVGILDTLYYIDSLQTNNIFFWRVKALNFIGVSDWSEVWSFSTEDSISIISFQLSLPIKDGWNMVSVPGVNPDGQGVDTWWSGRNTLADVYKWNGTYTAVTSATPTEGYWMLHTGANTYNTGDEWPAGGIQIVAHDPIAISTGWNMIGGYENSALVSGLTTTPAGLIVAGTVYGWSGTYFNPTNLEPGYGYWLLSTGDGVINPPTLAKGTSKIVAQDNTENWGKITLTDAAGKSYVLYAVNGEVNLESYQLPPLPPSGTFDVRYSSGKKAEKFDKEMLQTIEMSGITYPVRVRAENVGIRIQDETGKIVNERIKTGEEITISNSSVSKLMVSADLIPVEYALEQNYPNPFNPSTKIEFSLPEDVNNVTLTIYNALGQRVAELLNSKMEAGYYNYVWNASNIATGMYIYELRTDKFVSVKKMILLK